MNPESVIPDFGQYLKTIFYHPPDLKIMDLCCKCLIAAFRSNNSTAVKPQDYPFKEIILQIKKGNYPENINMNLLEIIFSLTNNQESYISQVTENDIDIFFKFYYYLPISSQINCMRCIKVILNSKYFDRYVTFIEPLLDIANSDERDERIFQICSEALKSIYDHFVWTKEVLNFIPNSPIQYCEKLCFFTMSCNDVDYLAVFIRAIKQCCSQFNFTKVAVVNRFNLSHFIGMYNERIAEEIFGLVLEFIPLPDDDSYESSSAFDLSGIQLDPSKNPNVYEKLIYQFNDAFPFVVNFLCTYPRSAFVCLKLILAMVYFDYFQVKFTSRLIYMLSFQSSKAEHFKLILYIIERALKIQENVQPILQSGLIDIVFENVTNKKDSCNELCLKKSFELKKFLNQNFRFNPNIFDFNNISEFANSIDTNPYLQLNLFYLYYKEMFEAKRYPESEKTSNVQKKASKLNDLRSIINDFDSIEISQKVVNFLLQFLAEIPIPCLPEDEYFPDYDKLINDKLVINGTEIPFNSIFSENRIDEINQASLMKTIDKDPVMKGVIDKSMFNEITPYELSVLYREMSQSVRSYCILDSFVYLYDLDQFTLHLMPFIIHRIVSKKRLENIKHRNFRANYECSSRYIKPLKKNIYYSQFAFFVGGHIVGDFLRLIESIYQSDKNRQINFIYQPFLQNILYQTQYMFLTMSLVTPCSQIMVSYPFLFDMSDRLFLFKLIIKEPLMARDFFYEKYHPNYAVEPRRNYAILKFVVDRTKIFQEGLSILERFAKYRVHFEIKFKGEMGLGRGPTKEFFLLMSKEFCKKRHRLWRRDNFTTDDSENDFLRLYAHNKQGLFPYATANSRYMYDLGLFVAKAIQMEEVIDIPFNPAFFDMANDREISLKDVDEALYNSLNDPSTEEALLGMPFQTNVEGKDFDLVKNGENILIDHQNFSTYKYELEKFVCGKYVKKVVNSFVNGFSEVMDPIVMKMFAGSEMIDVINGQRDLFSLDDLNRFITCGNGYNRSDQQINDLFQVIVEFDNNYQKLFLQFVTGSPFLPIGGLKSLIPPMTVIRKYSQNSKIRDEFYLPSSQTCTNTLYLPPYPSKEIMREKIIKVITECVQSFGLI